MTPAEMWQRYRTYLLVRPELGLRLDISRMAFSESFLDSMEAPMQEALAAMAELERGAIANPDEGRQVGHYWLRTPELAPEREQTQAIDETVAAIRDFASEVHSGRLGPSDGSRFSDLLLIGIGGSALGPQLLADALGGPGASGLRPSFFDNTDPDGMATVLAGLENRLASTLCVVVSKSGGTAETRNGMLVAQAAFREAGLDFASRAVAVTGEGSRLDRTASEEGWLARFPMWDWVGGRTSVTGPVGLLPAALMGLDIHNLLAGAAACDQATRETETRRNPAAMLALMWHYATGGVGNRDMVILPYKDRLLLMSRYLQQLVMESIGKGEDTTGQPVAQGISVYGNKGSTDQHAYVQQLREGVNNFFVTFVEVLEEGGSGLQVEPGITSGDYLRGFLLGTRQALAEGGRESLTLSLDKLDARSLGVLIALFERAVGLYASLVDINAYHQPGVEAGKRAASEVLRIQGKVMEALAAAAEPMTLEAVAAAASLEEEVETIFHLLEGLSANGRGVRRQAGHGPFDVLYMLDSGSP